MWFSFPPRSLNDAITRNCNSCNSSENQQACSDYHVMAPLVQPNSFSPPTGPWKHLNSAPIRSFTIKMTLPFFHSIRCVADADKSHHPPAVNFNFRLQTLNAFWKNFLLKDQGTEKNTQHPHKLKIYFVLMLFVPPLLQS